MTMNLRAAEVKSAVGEAVREARQADGDFGRLCLDDGTYIRPATAAEHEAHAERVAATLDLGATIDVAGHGDCVVIED